MSHDDFGSRRSARRSLWDRVKRAASTRRAAGLAARSEGPRVGRLEPLEPRVLLSAVDLNLDPVTDTVRLDNETLGFGATNTYRLVAPETDFVSILANGFNTNDPVDTTISITTDMAGTIPATDANGNEIGIGETNGITTDGRLTVELEAGQTYFIQVFSSNMTADLGRGDFNLIVDASTETALTPNATTGRAEARDQLVGPGGQQVFSFTQATQTFTTILAAGTNSVDPVDTTIDLYTDAALTQRATDAFGAVITTSFDNGTTAQGATTDAWVGAVLEAGQTYYVRVTAPTLVGSTSSPDREGVFDLFIDTSPIALAVSPAGAATASTDPALAFETDATVIRDNEIGNDRIFVFQVPTGDAFNGLGYANAVADPRDLPLQFPSTDFDSRVEVYDAQGRLVGGESRFGRLSNGLAFFQTLPGQTYYARVRSDLFRATDASGNTLTAASGEFRLNLDLNPQDLNLDPVSRFGSAEVELGGQFVPFGLPQVPFEQGIEIDNADIGLFRFQAQASGRAIINANGTDVFDIEDGAAQDGQRREAFAETRLLVFDDNGNLIANNDDLPNEEQSSQVEIDLVGGREYFVVATAYEQRQPADNDLVQNFSQSPLVLVTALADYPQEVDDDGNLIVDDYLNTPTGLTGNDLQRAFEDATPIVWSDPVELATDRQAIQFGTAQGRLQGPSFTQAGPGADTDLFLFVPPVDMLESFDGINDGNGNALFVGGGFVNVSGTASGGLASYDLGRWWDQDDNQPTRLNANGQAGRAGNRFFYEPTVLAPGPSPTAGVTLAEGTRLNGQIFTSYVWNDSPFGQPVLVIGGSFVVESNNPAIDGIQNLVVWDGFRYQSIAPAFAFDQIQLSQAQRDDFSPNGAVRAITEFDFDEGVDFNGDDPPLLVLGGDFTGNVSGTTAFDRLVAFAAFDANNDGELDAGEVQYRPVGQGIRGTSNAGGVSSVRTLSVFDPPDSDDGMGTMTQFAPHLIVGGDFVDGALQNFAALQGGGTTLAPSVGGISITTNGAINAFAEWDPPQETGMTPPPDPPIQLVVGGEFTTFAGINSPALGFAEFGTGQAGSPRAVSGAPTTLAGNSGANPVVNDLEVYEPNDEFVAAYAAAVGREVEGDPLLVVGGDFSFSGTTLQADNLAFIDDLQPGLGGFALPGLPTGATLGTVFDIELFEDEEGPGTADPNGGFETGDSLAIGIAAELFVPSLAGPPTLAGNVLQFNVRDNLELDVVGTAITGAGASSVPNVITAYRDRAGGWDRNGRGPERAQILVNGTDITNIASLGTQVRILDSNGDVIYTNTTLTGDEIPPDPTGGYSSGAFPGGPVLPEMWGGEVYFLEVSRTGLQETPTGAYEVQINVAGLREGTDGAGQYLETPDEGFFATAPELLVDNTIGVATNFTQTNLFPVLNQDVDQRFYGPTVREDGVAIRSFSDLSSIQSYTDTDLFRFTAPRDGFVEIRTSTSGILDQFTQTEAAPGDPVFTVTNALEKTYNSLLDTAVRVFNSDFIEVGHNDNLDEINADFSTGSFEPTRPADDGVETYRPTDSRLVIPVEAGREYFVQVEASQRQALADFFGGNDTLPIDWARTLGSYKLVVNLGGPPTGTLQVSTDDFVDGDTNGVIPPIPGNILAAQPIGVDATGSVDVSGVIRGEAGVNPIDTDMFTYTAPVSGTASITLTPTSAGGLAARLSVRDAAGLEVAAINGAAGEQIGTLLNTTPGQRFTFIVSGVAGSEGGYTLSIAGQAPVEDLADQGRWVDAVEIDLLSGGGSEGSASSSIVRVGDTDVFSFTAPRFADYTVSVLGTGVTPAVEVFEQIVDPSGNPFLRRIGIDANADQETVASVTFGGTQDRTSGLTGDTYPLYFVLVRGANPDTDEGTYTVNVSLAIPDDHADQGQIELATPIVIDQATGAGNQTGELEIDGDSDLFRFEAPSSGPTRIIADPTDIGSSLEVRLRILGPDGETVLADVSGDAGLPISADIDVLRSESYYVLISATTTAPGNGNAVTGSYAINVSAPTIDDHANAGEFGFATRVTLDPFDGDATVPVSMGTRPVIEPDTDTDLFVFDTIEVGEIQVTVDAFRSDVSDQFTPTITVFNASFEQIATTTATVAGASASLTIDGNAVGLTYYILVSDARAGADPITSTEYELTIEGPVSDPGGNPGEIDFADPDPIPTIDDLGFTVSPPGVSIGGNNDRDLYTFSIPAAPGKGGRPIRVFVQVVAPDGSPLDARVTILDAADENSTPVAQDSVGGPGSSARVEFSGTQGQQFWAIVEGVSGSTGAYRLEISTEPAEFNLYYPEGFAGDDKYEFVSVSNPNSFDVTYRVELYYADGTGIVLVDPSDDDTSFVIGGNSRGGVTLSLPTDRFPGFTLPAGRDLDTNALTTLQANTPYSVVLVADGPLGASSSRYDLNFSPSGEENVTGDRFAERPSETWTVARVERNPGVVNDFILVYNPNSTSTVVTLTAQLPGGETVTLQQTLAPNARGGWDINNEDALPVGIFGVTVTGSVPGSPGMAEDIVVSLTHFATTPTGSEGFAALGNPGGGDLTGVLTSLENGSAVNGELVLYNPGVEDAVVRLENIYVEAGLPTLTRNVTIGAGETITLSGSELQLIANQPAGIRYTSIANGNGNTLPITVLGVERQLGESNTVSSSAVAAQEWFFGDAFINASLAGDFYFETVSIYNPSPGTVANVDLELFFFEGGTTETISLIVGADGFAEVELHRAEEILGRVNPLVSFSVSVTSDVPVVASFDHYDLFLGGGWGAAGSPFGLTNGLSTIQS
ncbi:MAG: LEPR-XLL domain-containing protein [Planctomycetota bacterium]